MWYDGAPHQGQCEGCTNAVWHLRDAVYLKARGVSFAVVTTGAWPEVAAFAAFMGYTQPWYSVRDVPAPVGGEMGVFSVFLRSGDRVFLTYTTTGRGTEPANPTFALLDMTANGRGEAWQDNPDGRGADHDPCWYWRTGADGTPGGGPASRPAPQWTRPDVTAETTLGRGGHCH
jgi:predicted dithiol-disulfide oxidoreductase (DUF899 family)